MPIKLAVYKFHLLLIGCLNVGFHEASFGGKGGTVMCVCGVRKRAADGKKGRGRSGDEECFFVFYKGGERGGPKARRGGQVIGKSSCLDSSKGAGISPEGRKGGRDGGKCNNRELYHIQGVGGSACPFVSEPNAPAVHADPPYPQKLET